MMTRMLFKVNYRQAAAEAPLPGYGTARHSHKHQLIVV